MLKVRGREARAERSAAAPLPLEGNPSRCRAQLLNRQSEWDKDAVFQCRVLYKSTMFGCQCRTEAKVGLMPEADIDFLRARVCGCCTPPPPGSHPHYSAAARRSKILVAHLVKLPIRSTELASMAYNYGPPPGAYNNRQPSHGFSGAGAAAPGIGFPPGMPPAPGMSSQSPVGMPNSQFQAPPNVPGINFNAPVIRLGVPEQQNGKPQSPGDRLFGGQGGRLEGRGSNAEPLGRRDRPGLGAGYDGRNLDRERAAIRDSMMVMQPPTREEVARTIFIGGLGEGMPNDESLASILRCAGKLRRWTRARDADDKLCKFGFAEYEDVESLEAANEIFVDIEVPLFKGAAVQKDEEGEVKKSKLLVVVDEQSKNYINEWKGRRKENDDARQFRIDGCKEDLSQSLTELINAGSFMANGVNGEIRDGDVRMEGTNGETNGEAAEVVTIPLTLEDELSDIPQEMRATVAEEIKAFRDRSNRRDLERLRREEDLEHAERLRSGPRAGRLASPPTTAPSGPASASNGVPVGPRDRLVQGAPSGPRGYRGAQLPSDYVNGVTFVGPNGATNDLNINQEDEDASESDEELERRRVKRRDEELGKRYEDAVNRWKARERARNAAQEREKARDEQENRKQEQIREEIAQRLRDFNDDEEAKLGTEEYYYDRSAWLRKRGAYKDREARDDERDRAAEAREKADERRQAAEARGLADNFMDQMGSELEQKAAEQPGGGFGGFKMSLGSIAAQRSQQQKTAAPAAPRRPLGDVEGLLEDEEDAAASGLKRPELKPLPDLSTAPIAGEDLSEAERAQARQQLAAEIPTTTTELFAYPIQYGHLSSQVMNEQIRPFVEKKVFEYLGVQEDLLVDTVVDGLEEKKDAKGIVVELEDALEGEAEVLVRKVWRLVVFWTEVGARGLL